MKMIIIGRRTHFTGLNSNVDKDTEIAGVVGGTKAMAKAYRTIFVLLLLLMLFLLSSMIMSMI